MRVDPLSATLVDDNGDAAASVSFDVAAPIMGGRYELLGLLGAGAMGTVYRARDRELDELVALKVVKKELAAVPGMLDRFRGEVKLARRVTHRNVARTFDIGEDGGDRFLTMEFIDGESLSTLLERRRRLIPAEVISVATDLCAGLAAAHAANVLHRDLKPDNVIIAKDGRAVITDFGIARAIAESELARNQGGIAGTPAYMSPEQVEGAADLDERTDLYALGTIMYELLAGEPAWKGDSVVTIAAGRLLRPPPDVRAKVPEVPGPLAELIAKLMARQRNDRFESAEHTSNALDRVRTTTTQTPPSMPAVRRPAGEIDIAVLPLLDGTRGNDAYLAQNVTEDLIDLLSMVRRLRVRPRGDSARYADASRDVREAGRVLGVDVVVDGALRRVGDGVRVSIRLITVEDGFQLWAARFERPFVQVLEIADEAAAAIATALTSEIVVKPRAPVVDAEAQELYLRGRFVLHRGWFEVNREAVRLLEAAYQRSPDDPRIAGTYAIALARAHVNEAQGIHDPDHVRAIVARARMLDPSSGEARCASGLLLLGDADTPAAATVFLDALDVSPTSVDALDALGRILNEVGDVDRGVALLERALAIEPTLKQAQYQIARVHSLLGDDDAFMDALGPAPVDPGDYVSWLLIQARTLVWKHDVAAAMRLARDAQSAVGLAPAGRESIRRMLAAADGSLSDAGFEELKNALPVDARRTRRRAAFNAQLLTEIGAATGRIDIAFSALEATEANAFFDILWMDRCKGLDALRSDPRFATIRASVAARAKAVHDVIEARLGDS